MPCAVYKPPVVARWVFRWTINYPTTRQRSTICASTPALVIPRAELQFRTSRSGGPGGQHVNKVETRVELLFDVASAPSLSEDQRQRLLVELTTWLDNDGVLHLVSDSYRSQYRNREDVLARFVLLLQHALRPTNSAQTHPHPAPREGSAAAGETASE